MMNHIFCDRSVPLNVLLNDFIPVSAALSDEQIVPSISSAWELYIVPLLGDSFAGSVLDMAYNENASDEEKVLVSRLRRANANLAFWHNFTELNVHITDQGFQRQEGDTFKPLYRYQEIELKQQFKNKGFNALDHALAYLMENLEKFPEFSGAPACIDCKSSLIKGAAEVQKYVNINSSHLVYLVLQPLFKKIRETVVERKMGKKAAEFLASYLSGGLDADSQDAMLAEKLREKVAAVVILHALATHVRTVGSITDRGLYYKAVDATSTEVQSDTPGRDSDRMRLAYEFQHEAESYLHRLVHFVESDINEIYAGDPHDVLNRDNSHKKTFWA